MKRKLLLFILKLLGGQERTGKDFERDRFFAWMALHTFSLGYSSGYKFGWNLFIHTKDGHCEYLQGKTWQEIYRKAVVYTTTKEAVEKVNV